MQNLTGIRRAGEVVHFITQSERLMTQRFDRRSWTMRKAETAI
ncbi:hypothetical protein [Planococcus shenhongbingii]|uniref:Uncharacterized protein n=1 Tax=Planococcus shenhongbingii TaxID=3058398 RepID=A0ABT8NA82_9BACL|nr:hypothetical protein [Planococcus sp. N017]MDN7244801.1 hypothetical protein [Planococcus sp. N017]